MTESTFASRMLGFYSGLEAPPVPRGVHVMNPYGDRAVRGHARAFLKKYFADNRPRALVFGINPGRFGAGITGITFTDPVVLADVCGIPNELGRLRELSSRFIYEVIARWPSAAEFYASVFLTAVCPLGFTRGGLNLNYYDEPALARCVTPFITGSIRRHIAAGGRTDHAVVLGRGANAKFFQRLNAEYRFFETIHVLEHPRWVMQYRRKKLSQYLAKYEEALRSIV